jgi:hypothetical protein
MFITVFFCMSSVEVFLLHHSLDLEVMRIFVVFVGFFPGGPGLPC